MNDLILGVTEKKGIPIVNSVRVAEIFDKRHDHISQSIEDIKINLPKIGEIDWQI